MTNKKKAGNPNWVKGMTSQNPEGRPTKEAKEASERAGEATRTIATSHKRVRAKTKTYIPDAVSAILDVLLDKENEHSNPIQRMNAGISLIKLTMAAEAYLEKAQGIGTKDGSKDKVEDEEEKVDYLSPVVHLTAK